LLGGDTVHTSGDDSLFRGVEGGGGGRVAATVARVAVSKA
jgi:hypothetical protein